MNTIFANVFLPFICDPYFSPTPCIRCRHCCEQPTHTTNPMFLGLSYRRSQLPRYSTGSSGRTPATTAHPCAKTLPILFCRYSVSAPIASNLRAALVRNQDIDHPVGAAKDVESACQMWFTAGRLSAIMMDKSSQIQKEGLAYRSRCAVTHSCAAV